MIDEKEGYNLWLESAKNRNYTDILESDIRKCIDSYLSSVDYEQDYAKKCLLNEDDLNYFVPLLPSFLDKYMNLIYAIEIGTTADKGKLTLEPYKYDTVFIHCDIEFIINYFFSKELFGSSYYSLIFIIDSNIHNYTKVVIENSFIIIWNISMEGTEVWVPSFRQLQGIETIHFSKTDDNKIKISSVIPEVFSKNCTIYMMKEYGNSPILKDAINKISIKENNFYFYTVLYMGIMLPVKTIKEILGFHTYSDVALVESDTNLFLQLNLCNNSFGLNQIEILNQNKEEWKKSYEYAIFNENINNIALIIDNKLSDKQKLMLSKYAKGNKVHTYVYK